MLDLGAHEVPHRALVEALLAQLGEVRVQVGPDLPLRADGLERVALGAAVPEQLFALALADVLLVADRPASADEHGARGGGEGGERDPAAQAQATPGAGCRRSGRRRPRSASGRS
jgi:hypothetical protein